MKKFWIGFIVGGLFQATIGTIIGMNIAKAWPESSKILLRAVGQALAGRRLHEKPAQHHDHDDG